MRNVLAICFGVLLLGILAYVLYPKHMPSQVAPQSSITPQASMLFATSSALDMASTTPASSSASIVEQAPSLTLANSGTQFNGDTFTMGLNTIRGVTFTIVPFYDIGETYDNRCRGDCDQDAFEAWSRFEDFKFVTSCPAGWVTCEIDIYKAADKLGAVDVGSVAYGSLSIRTFSYQGRDYFFFSGTLDCGTGGCEDDRALYSYANGTSTRPFGLWDNSWGWGDGAAGQAPWGNEDGGKLDFVVGYNDNIFLFPRGGFSVVELDQGGNLIRSIDPGTSTLVDIITNASENR